MNIRTPFQSAVSWFEIPAADISRAKKFYETILGITMPDLELGNGLKMALFPTESDGIGGALAQHSDFYFPGHHGTLVYLNANPGIQPILDRIPAAGGMVLVPRTHISDDYGYMAVFQDSEGTRVALHSVEG